MKPLDDAQQADIERRIAEDRITGRGKRTALGVMFGVETGVVGATVAVLTGGLWFVGALVGVAATGVLWLLLLAVPLGLRARVGAFLARGVVDDAPWMRVEEPDPKRVYRSASIEGTSLPKVEKKPYWPQ